MKAQELKDLYKQTVKLSKRLEDEQFKLELHVDVNKKGRSVDDAKHRLEYIEEKLIENTDLMADLETKISDWWNA